MNELSAVSGQLPVKKQRSATSGQITTDTQKPSLRRQSSSGGTDKRNEEFREVAKEMESLFAHQLLKIMRRTAESMSPEKKGSGHSTYMELFDVEISRLFAERGLGLQDAIMNWLERMPDDNIKNKASVNNDSTAKEISGKSR